MQKTNYYKQKFHHFPLDAVYVGRVYDVSMQQKIRRFKFVNNPVDIVYFESLFTDIIQQNNIKNTWESIVVFPPISLRDRVLRWPNHAKRLAAIFAKNIGIKTILCPFRKRFFAGHQSKRTLSEREKISQDFCISDKFVPYVQGKNVFFVDDIITSWHTANTLGTFLKKLWAKSIVWCFLASKKV